MKPEDVAKSYDEIADVWNAADLNRDNGIRQHERAIAFVKEAGHALDIGCGSSGRFVDLLTRHGFTV